MDTENLAQSVKEYILQLEAQIAELQAENADLRDELEMFNHIPNF